MSLSWAKFETMVLLVVFSGGNISVPPRVPVISLPRIVLLLEAMRIPTSAFRMERFETVVLLAKSHTALADPMPSMVVLVRLSPTSWSGLLIRTLSLYVPLRTKTRSPGLAKSTAA